MTATPLDRATAADAVRKQLAAGDTRRAVHESRSALEAAAAAVRHEYPVRGQFLDAALAGSQVALAEKHSTAQPWTPAGYTGGPPSAADLLAVFTHSHDETAKRR